MFCAVAAWSCVRAAGDGDLAYGRERDAVLLAGERQIARLTTLDPARADAETAAWLSVTTGPLHRELVRDRQAAAEALAGTGSAALGTVTGAAVTRLDTRAGTARLIATVEVELTPAGPVPGPVTERRRYEAGLSRTGEGWKLSDLTALTPQPTGGTP
ncbi:hypothetical protein [Streptomyces sp. YIM 98790]|uniref:hypothetical protein n=1 Tax=Streptomyces sp. YIM 98790 TaxID=2689077 RepID=UPI001FB596B0